MPTHDTPPQGRYWVADASDRMPSSGLIATLMMLHACNTVDVYGTDFRPQIDPYHYWEEEKEWPEVWLTSDFNLPSRDVPSQMRIEEQGYSVQRNVCASDGGDSTSLTVHGLKIMDNVIRT